MTGRVRLGVTGECHAGPGGGAADRRIALGDTDRELPYVREFSSDGRGYPVCNVLQQVGWSPHLFCHYIVYFPVVESVLQRIGLRCFADVDFSLEIYSEQVAFASLVLETAVKGSEFHSFKFYCSVLFHFRLCVSDPSLRSG